MDEFCGSEFWNASYFGNATSQPDFTPCFEKTVLIWVPCIYLWLFAPLEARILIKSRDRSIPWSFFNISKIVCSSIILLLEAIVLISNIVKSSNQDVFAVDYYSPVFLLISIAVHLYCVVMEKKRGIQSSGYLFIFWMLLTVFGAPNLRSLIIAVEKDSSNAASIDFITYLLYYIIVVYMFFINFFADKRPEILHHPRSKKSCPEDDASFPSRLAFSWLSGLIRKGYRKPITQDMLWDLSYNNCSRKVTKDWDKHWDKALQKSYKKGESRTTARYINNSSSVHVVGTSADKNHYISILPTMVKCFGLEFCAGSILKLIHDLLQFVTPILIRLVIDFTEDYSQPNWLGYIYAICFLVVTQAQSLFLGQYFIKMFLIGLKIRTAIISAVYKKALRISNSARKESTVGEIVNLMSVDAQRFMDLTTYLNMIWSAPVQIALCLYFLWQILGPSVLAGLAVMVFLIPINGFLANKQKILQIRQMKLKDHRVKLINEILNGIKVLKLYAWEPSFEEKVLTVRRDEISVLKKAAYLNTATSFLWTCTPFIVTFFMFMTYVLVSPDHKLEPDIVFVSITLLNIMRMPLTILPIVIVSMVQAGVSLQRMNKFLNADELDPNAVSRENTASHPILIENGTFAWSKSKDDSDILNHIDLAVQKGSLVAVVGSVGSGKSSLCSAILGEMEKVSGKVTLKGSTTYVPQQAWIQNATLEENILFGKLKNECFYQEIVDACALRDDFDMLPAKDQTEIGEKGINLSGGQKQRVSVARSVYADADIYIMDDPLSAVDSHVGRHMFNHVIGSRGLLAKKTRILVTHSLSYLPKMDHIVVIKDGRISEQGSYPELMAKKGELQEFLLQYIAEEKDEEVEELEEIKQELEKSLGKAVLKRQISRISRDSESSSDGKVKSCDLNRSDSLRHRGGGKGGEKEKDLFPNGKKVGEKLIEAEKVETGKVSLAVYRYYMKAVGYFITFLTVFFYAASQGFSVGTNVWLSKWSEDDSSTDPAVRDKYLGVYGGLGILQALTIVFGFGLLARSTLVASKRLHERLLRSIMRCHNYFFDMTPTGRLVNRFAKDIDTLDVLIPQNLRSIVLCTFSVVATMAIITYATPIFIVALVPVMILYYFIQLMYVRSSRQLKRIESITRSPIYSHFGESIQGAVTIRAYGKEHDFILESEKKVDENQVSYHPSINANRWLAIRLELLGNLLTFFAALFAVMSRDTITGGDVGLSISYALSVTQTLNWLVRMTSEVETNIVAVERIKEYSETEQEAAWVIEDKRPPSGWPSKGVVRFDNYSTRYRTELDLVIKRIDYEITPMEKVGIVGRTGAGKSSMTLALFRIIEPAGGRIVIDGINVAEIGLHDLRSNLTIIPQDPVLFSGTLRMNLDPFDSFSDRAIWNALEHAHLKEYVSNLGSKLQHEISEGGENLSVGQRQLVCLARALLRKTKVLVLDEATAAVDLETDRLIQETIRREFADCTVITIAHRLNTIMDSDRVLVMDKGTIKEFDSPKNLLNNNQSIFHGMAKDAGLV